MAGSEKLERVVKMATRVANIISALRGFARESSDDPFVSVTVGSLLHDAQELCRERFKAGGIELVVADVDQALATECQASEIAQVLVNRCPRISGFADLW